MVVNAWRVAFNQNEKSYCAIEGQPNRGIAIETNVYKKKKKKRRGDKEYEIVCAIQLDNKFDICMLNK